MVQQGLGGECPNGAAKFRWINPNIVTRVR